MLLFKANYRFNFNEKRTKILEIIAFKAKI